MCPYTTTYVFSYYYARVLILLCVFILLRMCPHTPICVLILRCMCPHNTTMCPHTPICVLILRYMCPHTPICVLILLCMCPHPGVYLRQKEQHVLASMRRMQEEKQQVLSLLALMVQTHRLLALLVECRRRSSRCSAYLLY